MDTQRKTALSKRKIAAIAVLLSGVVFSYFIVRGEPSQGEKLILQIEEVLNQRGSPSLSYQRSAELLKSVNASGNDPKTSVNEVRPGNLTDAFVQSYLTTVAGKNTKNENLKEKITLPSQESIENILTNNALKSSFSETAFTPKDILVSLEGGTQATQEYVSQVFKISENNFKNFKGDFIKMIDAAIEKRDARDLQQYISIASKQVRDLLALRVPSSLTTLHIEQLNLWQKKISVYSAIVNVDEDPLKAALALSELQTILEQNAVLKKLLMRELEPSDL